MLAWKWWIAWSLVLTHAGNLISLDCSAGRNLLPFPCNGEFHMIFLLFACTDQWFSQCAEILCKCLSTIHNYCVDYASLINMWSYSHRIVKNLRSIQLNLLCVHVTGIYICRSIEAFSGSYVCWHTRSMGYEAMGCLHIPQQWQMSGNKWHVYPGAVIKAHCTKAEI